MNDIISKLNELIRAALASGRLAFAMFLVAMLGLLCVPKVEAQVVPTTLGTSLSNIVTLGTVTSNLVNAREITVTQGKGMAFDALLCGTQSTNTGTIAFLYMGSVDGTNYPTTPTFIMYATANGSTAVRTVTNVPPTTLDNLRKLKLVTITNALGNMGAITVSNVFTGVKN